jgi:hypothetical protein
VRLAVLFAAFLLPAAAELPEYYKTVDRIVWVVGDIDQAIAGWQKLGLLTAKETVSVNVPVTFRDKSVDAHFLWASAQFADLKVDFVQPTQGVNAFSEFQKKHKAGVMALIHSVRSPQELKDETQRLAKLGVKALQRGVVEDDIAESSYVLFDTEPQGKYVLGLVYMSDQNRGPLAAPPARAGGRKVSQFAFAVRDLDAVSRYWAGLGWPEMTVSHTETTDKLFRGKPADFDMMLGWHRFGRVPFEWILSAKGPNVYEEHMKVHGEGIHHLAFDVPDIDAAVEEWQAAGFSATQSGGWGMKGEPGSGRFSYHNAQAHGGIDIELLWNFRPSAPTPSRIGSE